MQQRPDYPYDVCGTSVATTAHHMAEALTFLMRVASEAGLPNVAVKLEDVRATVVRLAISQPTVPVATRDETEPQGPRF
jgi:hypothetical protein